VKSGAVFFLLFVVQKRERKEKEKSALFQQVEREHETGCLVVAVFFPSWITLFGARASKVSFSLYSLPLLCPLKREGKEARRGQEEEE
jgi:hypothetical protein